MNDCGLSPLSGLPLVHQVQTLLKQRPVWQNTEPRSYNRTTTNGEVFYHFTGEPGGAWATSLTFAFPERVAV